MNRDRMFELRVLTGTHAGARALLPQEPQVLGSSDDCDLILSDEGILARHARLERQADGSTILRWLDGGLDPVTIRPGQGAAVGPVNITVEAVDAPWRNDVPIASAPPDVRDPAPGPAADASACGEMAAEAAARTAPVTHPALTWRRRALVLSLIATVAFAAWLRWPDRPVPEPRHAQLPEHGADGSTRPAVAQDPARAAQAPSQSQQVITRLRLQDRAHVERKSDREVVQAVLLHDDEAESLAAALARVAPRPRLRLWSEEDIRAMVLDAAGADTARGITARDAGDGRFLVSGRIADESVRTRVQQAWVRQLGATPLLLDLQVRTDAQARTAFVDALRASGFEDVEANWDEGRLLMQARIARGQQPAWERALLVAARNVDLPFRAQLAWTDPTPARSGSPSPASPVPPLPFGIRSIASSDLPFLMLADGRKLVAGATVSGWRLVEIRPQEILFEAPGGRRVTLER